MSVWQQVPGFVLEHWDDLVVLAGLVGGIFGWKVRRTKRVATVEEIVGAALKLCRQVLAELRARGAIADETVLEDWIVRFEQLAGALGFQLAPATWKRVLDAVKAEMVTHNLAHAERALAEHGPKLEALLRRLEATSVAKAAGGSL